jgi:hypothetical protein
MSFGIEKSNLFYIDNPQDDWGLSVQVINPYLPSSLPVLPYMGLAHSQR